MIKTGKQMGNAPCGKLHEVALEDAHSSQNGEKPIVAASKNTAIALMTPPHKLEAVPKKTRRKTTTKTKSSKKYRSEIGRASCRERV